VFHLWLNARVKIVGIIPVRYASTRFPGKPLIQHVVERCRLVVATQRLVSTL